MAKKAEQTQAPQLFHGFGDLEVPSSEAVAVTTDSPVTDTTIESHLLLLGALKDLRTVNQLNGFVEISTSEYADPIDENAQNHIENIIYKRGRHATQARSHFEQATTQLIEREVDEEELTSLGLRNFSDL